MEKIMEKLNELSKDIEKAKKNKASLEGRQTEILRQLKGKYNVDSIEAAEDLLKSLELEEKTLEKEIKVKFSELKKEHGL